MARSARIKTEFGIFHIIQHGGSCRNLFENNQDREKFVSILERTKEKFNFVLHGYCLLDSNRYDLIIDVNGGDLSKIMKSINIGYAMYVKCNGKLFSDRFKSTLLKDANQLLDTKQMIKNNKKMMTSSNKFNICFDEIQPINLESLDLDDCNNCIKCMTTASGKLDEIANKKGLLVEDLIKEKDVRNQLIRSFRKSSTLSLKSLGELFGGLLTELKKRIKNFF
jgi:hypothetical protein